MYSEGDPGVPTPPTQLTHHALNALQEEFAKAIEGAGLTLRASGADDEAAGYGGQLLEAIKALNPVKAWARLRVASGAVTLLAGLGVSAAVLQSRFSGGYVVRVTFDVTPPTTPETRVIEAYQLTLSQLVPNVPGGTRVDLEPQVGIASNQMDFALYLGASLMDLTVATVDFFVRVTN